MRYALAALLLAGCSDATELRVEASTSYVVVSSYDQFCTCDRQAPPTAGQCTRFTDVKTGDECNCRKDCVSSLSIERDGGVIATAESDSIEGNFLGASLVVRGCGEDVVVPLPADVPSRPTINSIKPGPGVVEVAWTSPPPVDLVEVHSGTLAGATCFVAPELSTFSIYGVVGTSVSVSAIQVIPVFESKIGFVRTFAKTRVEAAF